MHTCPLLQVGPRGSARSCQHPRPLDPLMSHICMKGQVPMWGQAPLSADLRAQGSPLQPSGPAPRSSRWEGPRTCPRRPWVQSRGWPTVPSRRRAVRTMASRLIAPSVEHQGEKQDGQTQPAPTRPLPLPRGPSKAGSPSGHPEGAGRCPPQVQVWRPWTGRCTGWGVVRVREGPACPALAPAHPPAGIRTVSPRASVSASHRDEGHSVFLEASQPSCGQPPHQAQETRGRMMCSNGLLVPFPLPTPLGLGVSFWKAR